MASRNPLYSTKLLVKSRVSIEYIHYLSSVYRSVWNRINYLIFFVIFKIDSKIALMKAVLGIAGIFIRWNSMDYADSPESLVSTIKEFKVDQAMLSQMQNAGMYLLKIAGVM